MNFPEAFYLHISGTQRGPYTVPQIDHLLHSGLIAEETLYWREGLDQWQPVTSLVALRKKPNPWIKPALALALLAAIAVPVRIFGPVALVGWHEANQPTFSASAAYWRARDVVRNQALAPNVLVDFANFDAAKVELRAPNGADVKLRGEVTDAGGQTQPAAWSVTMRFDAEAKVWSGSPAREVALEK